jgi:hypothetical protein
MRPRLNPKKLTVPAEDLTYDASARLCLDGDKMRYSYLNKIWSVPLDKFVDLEFTSVFDGAIPKSLLAMSGDAYPTGKISRLDHHEDAHNANLKPLLLSFRPLDASLGIGASSNWAVSSQRGIVGGHTCRILESTNQATDIDRSIWVDPERDWIVLRYLETNKEKVIIQIDVDYESDPTHGWVPSSWRITWCRPDGPVQEASVNKVTEYTINDPVDAAMFDIEFPPETCVEDQRTPSALGGMTKYIVLADGKKRVIRPGELQMSHDELLTAGKRKEYIIVAVTLALLTAAVLALIWIRRRRQSTRPLS